MVFHLRSAGIISGVLPLAVLFSFIGMKQFGIDANVVALSGIAIAIGTIVDMGVVLVENILKHLEAHDKATVSNAGDQLVTTASKQDGVSADVTSDTPTSVTPAESRKEVIYRACTEVGGAVTTAVMTTIISFLPVFTMEAAEGKLFQPLAYTKTFALIGSIVVALTIIPPLAHWLLGRRKPPMPTKSRNWNIIKKYLHVFLCVIAALITGYFLAND